MSSPWKVYATRRKNDGKTVDELRGTFRDPRDALHFARWLELDRTVVSQRVNKRRPRVWIDYKARGLSASKVYFDGVLLDRVDYICVPISHMNARVDEARARAKERFDAESKTVWGGTAAK